MTTTAVDLEVDAPGEVLERARALRAVADRAEAELLEAAVAWAAMHSADSVVTGADWQEAVLPLAGAGAPEVAEFCIAELSAAIGLSTDAGRRYLGDALELRHRLPRLWSRVRAGELQAWRARRIAQTTVTLPADAAAYVDRHVAPVAHRVGVVRVERLVEEARARFDLEELEARALEAAESRHATVHVAQSGPEGHVDLTAVLDLPDALDLEHALRAGAERLAEQGSTEPLDVRRAQALGLLARGELTGPERVPRRIALHVHVSDDALASGLARVEQTRGFVLIDRLAEWCTDPAAQLDVRPVVDLTDHVHVEAYEVPDRLATRMRLRDHHCAFPHCTRPAAGCDCDHVVPHAAGGATCSCNLAPLCRRHHRLKTHTNWRCTVLEPGTYLWSSPHGYSYLRDHHGTLDVTARRPPPTAGCLERDYPPDAPSL